MQFSNFLVLLFAINVNTARQPDQSLGLLSKLLGRNSQRPLVLVVRPDGNIESYDTSVNRHHVADSHSHGSRPSVKVLDQRQSNNARLNQLRLLAKLVGGYKSPLRHGCNKGDSCEEEQKQDSCQKDDECELSDECGSDNSCEESPKCDGSTKSPDWYECKKPAQQCYAD